MSKSNGLSVTEQEQPLSKEEQEAIYEEIFNAVTSGQPVSERKVDKAVEDARQYVESKKAVEAPAENAEATQEEVTAEAPEQTEEEPADQPVQEEVVIKPEDYQAVLAEKAKWEQKAKSLDGREAARARQIQQLEAELNKLRQQPKQPDQKQAPTQGKQDPRWEALRSADPELADLLTDLKNEIRQEALREAKQIVDQSVEPIYRQQSESYAERELARLEQMIPNAREILEHPAYAEWYQAQPEYIQRAANESAEDAAWVLNKYGHDMSLRYPPAPVTQTQTREAPASDPKVAQLQAERNKRVQVGQVTQKTVAAPKQDTFDPNEYFEKQFASHLRKK